MSDKEITTEEIVNNWIYVDKTEGNGKHYHDLKSDRSSVIYQKHTKVSR